MGCKTAASCLVGRPCPGMGTRTAPTGRVPTCRGSVAFWAAASPQAVGQTVTGRGRTDAYGARWRPPTVDRGGTGTRHAIDSRSARFRAVRGRPKSSGSPTVSPECKSRMTIASGLLPARYQEPSYGPDPTRRTSDSANRRVRYQPCLTTSMSETDAPINHERTPNQMEAATRTHGTHSHPALAARVLSFSGSTTPAIRAAMKMAAAVVQQIAYLTLRMRSGRLATIAIFAATSTCPPTHPAATERAARSRSNIEHATSSTAPGDDPAPGPADSPTPGGLSAVG